MKFGRVLAASVLPAWAPYYVAYSRLKKELSQRAKAAGLLKTSRPRAGSAAAGEDGALGGDIETRRRISRACIDDLAREVCKVNSFVGEQTAAIDAQRDAVMALRSKLVTAPAAQRQQLRRELVELERRLWQLTRDLIDFVELNYQACYKFSKKCDKVTGVARMSTVMAAIDAQPFMEVLAHHGVEAHGPSVLARPLGLSTTMGIAQLAAEPHQLIGMAVDNQEQIAAAALSASSARVVSDEHIDVAAAAATLPDAVSVSVQSLPAAAASAKSERALGMPTSPSLHAAPPTLPAASSEPRTRRNSDAELSRQAAVSRPHIGRSASAVATTTEVAAANTEDVGLSLDTLFPSTTPARLLSRAASSVSVGAGMRLSSSGRLRTATPDAEALGLRVARPSNGVLLPAPTQQQQQQQQQLHVHTAATTPSVAAEKGSGLMYLPAPYPSALAFGQMAAGERATSATTAPTPSQLHVQRDVSAVSEARSVSFWERHEPAIEAGMMNAFEDLLQRMKELMNTCMHLLSPELISSKAELIQRLSPFSLTVMRSRREPKAIASAAASVRHLHDAILASKLEVFRSMLQVVLEQCELVFPEASAALEILSLGHFELFGLYMNETSHVPTRDEVRVLQRLRAISTDLTAAADAASKRRLPVASADVADSGATGRRSVKTIAAVREGSGVTTSTAASHGSARAMAAAAVQPRSQRASKLRHKSHSPSARAEATPDAAGAGIDVRASGSRQMLRRGLGSARKAVRSSRRVVMGLSSTPSLSADAHTESLPTTATAQGGTAAPAVREELLLDAVGESPLTAAGEVAAASRIARWLRRHVARPLSLSRSRTGVVSTAPLDAVPARGHGRAASAVVVAHHASDGHDAHFAPPTALAAPTVLGSTTVQSAAAELPLGLVPPQQAGGVDVGAPPSGHVVSLSADQAGAAMVGGANAILQSPSSGVAVTVEHGLGHLPALQRRFSWPNVQAAADADVLAVDATQAPSALVTIVQPPRAWPLWRACGVARVASASYATMQTLRMVAPPAPPSLEPGADARSADAPPPPTAAAAIETRDSSVRGGMGATQTGASNGASVVHFMPAAGSAPTLSIPEHSAAMLRAGSVGESGRQGSIMTVPDGNVSPQSDSAFSSPGAVSRRDLHLLSAFPAPSRRVLEDGATIEHRVSRLHRPHQSAHRLRAGSDVSTRDVLTAHALDRYQPFKAHAEPPATNAALAASEVNAYDTGSVRGDMQSIRDLDARSIVSSQMQTVQGEDVDERGLGAPKKRRCQAVWALLASIGALITTALRLLDPDPHGLLAFSGVSAGTNERSGHPVTFLKRMYLKFHPAMFDWLGEYSWRKNLPRDLLAGLTVGIFHLPQGLAYATLAGLPPVYGLYTGFPAAIYAVFGSSRHAAIGPQSIPALLIASGISGITPEPTAAEYIGYVMSVSLISGCLMLLMGWLNLGFIIRFISRPVLAGFISASAILTICSTAKDLLGTAVPRSQYFHDYVYSIAKALPKLHWQTLLVGLSAVFALWSLSKWKHSRRLPPPLIVVVFYIVLFVSLLKGTKDAGEVATPAGGVAYQTQQGIRLVGFVPAIFPSLTAPSFSGNAIGQIVTTAVTVTFVGLLESIAVAKIYAVKYGYDISASSELKALGCTNLFGSFAQSFVIMGSFGRSAVNDAAGARSPLSQIISALVVVLLVLFVTPAVYYLPQAVLAAIVIMAVVKLIDVGGVRRLWRIDKRDFIVMVAAFLATLFLGVLYGVVAAMGFSLVIFIGMATQPNVEELGRETGTVIYRHLGAVGVTKVNDVKIIKFLAPLFFANCTVLKDRVLMELIRRKLLPPRLRWHAIVLCFSSVSSIDTTALQVLEEIIVECHGQRLPLLIASANASVEESLASSGVLDKLGGERFMFRRVHEAVRALLLRSVSAVDIPTARPHGGVAHVSAKRLTDQAQQAQGPQSQEAQPRDVVASVPEASEPAATAGVNLVVRSACFCCGMQLCTGKPRVIPVSDAAPSPSTAKKAQKLLANFDPDSGILKGPT